MKHERPFPMLWPPEHKTGTTSCVPLLAWGVKVSFICQLDRSHRLPRHPSTHDSGCFWTACLDEMSVAPQRERGRWPCTELTDPRATHSSVQSPRLLVQRGVQRKGGLCHRAARPGDPTAPAVPGPGRELFTLLQVALPKRSVAL